MFRRGKVKPSKSSSVFSMAGGIIFIIIGLTIAIPMMGWFGLLWTLFAVVITGSHAYNVFSKKGLSAYQVDVEVTDTYQKKELSFDEKMRRLKSLKDDELISAEEYELKRKEILNEKW